MYSTTCLASSSTWASAATLPRRILSAQKALRLSVYSPQRNVRSVRRSQPRPSGLQQRCRVPSLLSSRRVCPLPVPLPPLCVLRVPPQRRSSGTSRREATAHLASSPRHVRTVVRISLLPLFRWTRWTPLLLRCLLHRPPRLLHLPLWKLRRRHHLRDRPHLLRLLLLRLRAHALHRWPCWPPARRSYF
jgi:hypothetical protein